MAEGPRASLPVKSSTVPAAFSLVAPSSRITPVAAVPSPYSKPLVTSRFAFPFQVVSEMPAGARVPAYTPSVPKSIWSDVAACADDTASEAAIINGIKLFVLQLVMIFWYLSSLRGESRGLGCVCLGGLWFGSWCR